MNNRIESFLQDFTYNTRFEFLEEGKDKEELKEIAEKRGIKLPAHDLAVFKGRYAYTDRMNLNKCILPSDEVELALETLNGKAIDFDHYRKNVVGHWIDAKLDGNEILAYGIFFKGNFPEDYATIQELMEKDVLAISMEAWGSRNIHDDGSYSLKDIEFAGGALLIKSKPAAPGSEVLELSNHGKMLEMAKVLTPPESFIHTGDFIKEVEEANTQDRGKCVFSAGSEKVNDNKDHFPINDMDQAKKALERASQYTTAPKWYNGSLSEVVEKVKNAVKKEYPTIEISEELPEVARYHIYDIESIFKVISQVDCLTCTEKGFADIDMIDFKNNQASISCIGCNAEMKVDLTPMAKLSKKGRKIKQIETISHDSTQVVAGVNTDNVEINPIKEEEQSMKILMEKYQVDSVDKLVQTLAKETISRELNADELSFAYTVIEYKAGGGAVNDTSLMSLKGKSVANPVSLVAAGITEEDIKTIMQEIDKLTKSEQVSLAEETPKVEEKKEEIVAQEVPKVEEALKEETPKEQIVDEATQKLLEEIATLKAKVDVYEKAQKDAEAKVRTEQIESRRKELGEFGKDLSDEQLLENDKYTIAKQTQIISMLQAGKDVKKEINQIELSKGSADKDINVESEVRKRIRDLAWSDDKNTDDKDE